MKCSVFILGFLISASTFAICQDTIITQARLNLSKELVRRQSNSDAETFGGYLSAVGQFVGKDGNTITFQPRMYDLDKLFCNKNIDVDTYYERIAWERNLQINVGFTPNAINLFTNPANFQIGFTFAVINNKEIPVEDYRSVMNSYQVYTELQRYLTEQIQTLANDTIKTMIMKIINHQDYSYLPKFLRDSVEKKFDLPISKMMEIPKNLVDSLSHILPRRPQLIFDVNALHGLGNRGEAGLNWKTSFSSYIFVQKKGSVDPQVNLSASYSLADNITRTVVNLGRSIFDVSAGINIIFFSRFELKPGVSYMNIFSGLYAHEHQIAYSPTASFFIKIAEKFVAAINWSYNSDKAASTANFKLKTSLE
jgi:hypothetical protein